MNQRSRRKVVFLHVAKTGGISFRRILRNHFRESFHVCGVPTIAGIETAMRKYDAVELHSIRTPGRDVHLQGELLRQGRCDLLAGADVFTMLRDPVDHVVSMYFYAVEERQKRPPNYALENWTFPDSLEAFVDRRDGLNGQLANLVGKNWGMDGEKTREDLELVKAMLVKNRVHVGILDRFADSVRVFEDVVGVAAPDESIPIENRTLSRPSLRAVPEKLKQLIRDRSALDQELYEFGRKLFLEDFAAYRESRSSQASPLNLNADGVAAWPSRLLHRLLQSPLKSAILHDLDDNRRKHDLALGDMGLR